MHGGYITDNSLPNCIQPSTNRWILEGWFDFTPFTTAPPWQLQNIDSVTFYSAWECSFKLLRSWRFRFVIAIGEPYTRHDIPTETPAPADTPELQHVWLVGRIHELTNLYSPCLMFIVGRWPTFPLGKNTFYSIKSTDICHLLWVGFSTSYLPLPCRFML
jgi:hypothetical protein